MTETNIDVDLIVKQLRQMQNAANVHTINKAVFYLRFLSGEAFDSHAGNCQSAINSKQVAGLAIAMRRWQ